MNLKEKLMNSLMLHALQKGGQESIQKFDAQTTRATSVNKQLLQRLLQDNKNTEYGKKYNFASVQSVDDYRKNVPFTTYNDYEPYIDRMVQNGEQNLMTAYPVVYYASTSGTSGSPKKIPVTDKGMQVFQSYATKVSAYIVSEFYATSRQNKVPDGKVLMPINFNKTVLESGAPFGAISSACFDEKMLKLSPYLLTTPVDVMLCNANADLKYLNVRYAMADRNVVYLVSAYIPTLLDLMNYGRQNWEMIVKDIREGTIDESITMPPELRAKLLSDLKPDPRRADELQKEFEKGIDDTLMGRIWPELSAVMAIWAGNFSLYARKLQKYSGRSLPYYTMSYVSSEGIFGIGRHPFDQYYVLIPDSCFYEFIPMEGSAGQDEQNPATLLMDEVEEGKEYELVITNQSGLYRYRMGDVVKVIGFYNESPMVVFKYRQKTVVSLVGEKFTEDHLLTAVRELERQADIQVIDFCMYPDRDCEPGRYVIFLEPEEIVPQEKLKQCQEILERELARASTSYAHYLPAGDIGKPKLVFLQRDTFQLYREMKMYKQGISENQLKPVRVLNTPELIKFFSILEEKYETPEQD